MRLREYGGSGADGVTESPPLWTPRGWTWWARYLSAPLPRTWFPGPGRVFRIGPDQLAASGAVQCKAEEEVPAVGGASQR
ncbi:hypothetical protein GCM10010282_09090 [Streptomyces roseolus]|nr:hypothetical protein GCM10010282_09090 [Streptomyces roseolus]